MPQNALNMYNSTFTSNKNFTFSMNLVINDLYYISFVCLMTSPLPLSKSKLLCSPLKGVANFCLFSTESCHLQQTNKLFGIYTILDWKNFWFLSLMNYFSFHNILFPLFFWCVQFVTILYNFGQCTFSGKSLSVTRVSCK